MELHGNARLLQRHVVRKRVFYTVYVVVLVLQQECRRGLRRDVSADIGIQSDAIRRHGKVPRIQSHGEVRTAALIISSIDGLVQTPVEMDAHRRDEVPARRETEHANLVRVDMPLGRMKAYQSD